MPTFETPGPITAVIDAHWAFVHVSATDRTDTVVEVTPNVPSKKSHVAAAEATRVIFGNDRLEIITPKARGLIGSKQSVNITIRLPSGSVVEGATLAGDFKADGPLKSCGYKTGGGDIAVDQVGALNLDTAAGKITIDRVAGSGTVTTGFGDITVREAVRGDVALNTGHGHIDAGVHPDAAVTVDTSVQFGTVRNSVHASKPNATESLVLHAKSQYGDLHLHWSDAA